MKKIAVLSTFLSETHARQVLSGIMKCAQENDCSVFVFTCKMLYDAKNKHDVGEYMVFDKVDFSSFDAAIIASSTIWSEPVLRRAFERIKKNDIPAVSLERYTPEAINVVIDNKTAMKEIIHHMICEHGYRRINYIAGVPGNAEAIARFEAFKEALLENGIPYEPERVFWGDWLKSSGEAAVAEFYESKLPFPDAIACSTDKNALGAYTALTRLGLRVPQDVALSGFDGDVEGKYHIPALTTVERMPELSGYKACEAVLHGMQAGDKGKTITIKTNSVFRESCGCTNKQRLQEKQFRKLYFQNLDTNEKLIHFLDSISIDLTTVADFGQLKNVLGHYAKDFGGSAFYLAVYDGVLSSAELDLYSTDGVHNGAEGASESETISLIFAYENGRILDEKDREHTELEALISGRQNCAKGGDSYVVAPIHFEDRYFGFCVLKNSTIPFESELFYTLVTNMGNAIQTIKTQQLKQLMIEKLESVWCLDSLTGVYNREGFKKFGGRVWEEAVRRHTNIMMLFADLDGLKKINDTYGHDKGDHYIRMLADVFKAARHHGEVIMRYGGDEFVVISNNVTEEYAKGYVQEIQRRIEETNQRCKNLHQLSASVGYFLLNPTEKNLLDEAIFKADKEMYHIKKQRNSQTMTKRQNAEN